MGHETNAADPHNRQFNDVQQDVSVNIGRVPLWFTVILWHKLKLIPWKTIEDSPRRGIF